MTVTLAALKLIKDSVLFFEFIFIVSKLIVVVFDCSLRHILLLQHACSLDCHVMYKQVF